MEDLNRQEQMTQLSEIQYNKSAGILQIICGITAIIGGLFMLTIIIGIFAIIGGVALIGIGAMNLSGFKTGICPYCNNDLKIKASSKTVKCPQCKKISTVYDNCLKKID